MTTPTTNWSMESMPWKIQKTDHTGDVMEFTAHTPHNNSIIHRALLHQKRKSDPVPPPFPVKQFISEEKITAHFNGLHISSDYIQHDTGGAISGSGSDTSTTGKCFSNLTYEDYQMTAKELEKKLLNANRITICDELKKISEQPAQHSVSCLPETLLHRFTKPCTALVLWQPPPPIINMLKSNTSQAEEAQCRRQQETDLIVDDGKPDVDLPPERDDDDIDDYVDNNNTCSLDFNHIKPDSMDEDM
ncbi:uncharacterized protein LOC133329306 [Musca vetustissima]|uniref:uncharacterized protein LOC133329306 n=1 Tax=Musca vetustissima TaxID=27455 RepID=UPI002AB6F521|nr:uncharacterized protein LOC133329306 [Musca vetustissima]